MNHAAAPTLLVDRLCRSTGVTWVENPDYTFSFVIPYSGEPDLMASLCAGDLARAGIPHSSENTDHHERITVTFDDAERFLSESPVHENAPDLARKLSDYSGMTWYAEYDKNKVDLIGFSNDQMVAHRQAQAFEDRLGSMGLTLRHSGQGACNDLHLTPETAQCFVNEVERQGVLARHAGKQL